MKASKSFSVKWMTQPLRLQKREIRQQLQEIQHYHRRDLSQRFQRPLHKKENQSSWARLCRRQHTARKFFVLSPHRKSHNTYQLW
jgi:hypothetical protein